LTELHGALGRCFVRGSLLLSIGCSGETRISLLENENSVLREAGALDAAHPREARAPDAAVSLGLIHRYDFAGTGNVAFDRIGTAHASLRGGATLDGSGAVELDGIDDFVDLPNGLVSSLESTTLVTWLRWYGGNCWHRVFDFGSTVEGEGISGTATSNMFVTPRDCPGPGPTALLGRRSGSLITEVSIRSPTPFTTQADHQVALVVDGDTMTMQLYIDAQANGQAALRVGLGAIDDVNNWLGRSQWRQDFNLPGRYDEFRIYAQALSSAELMRLRELGPELIE
jgi:Concanavalin A-like lectin/glucanases superfamily